MERLMTTNVSAQLRPARIQVPTSSVIERDLVKVKFEIFTINDDNQNLQQISEKSCKNMSDSVFIFRFSLSQGLH